MFLQLHLPRHHQVAYKLRNPQWRPFQPGGVSINTLHKRIRTGDGAIPCYCLVNSNLLRVSRGLKEDESRRVLGGSWCGELPPVPIEVAEDEGNLLALSLDRAHFCHS